MHPYGRIGTDKNLTASTRLGDLDGDGDMDIVVANGRHWSEQNRVFFNDGKGFFRRSISLGTERNTTYVTPVVDIDNDGDLDVLVGNDRIRNQVFKNDGSGNLVFDHYFGFQTSNTRGLCTADLNGDGFVDVAVANRQGQNYIYFNNGKGNYADAKSFGGPKEATITIAAADMDGDGSMDLVLANRDGQPNYIYFGSKFVKKITYGTGSDESRDVDVGDMDGDGQLDIVVANIGDRNMIYYGSNKRSYIRSKAFGDPAAATHSIIAGGSGSRW